MKVIADNLHPDAALVLLAALARANGGVLTVPGVAESQATIQPYFRLEVHAPDGFDGEGWPDMVELHYSGVDELPEGATTNDRVDEVEAVLRALGLNNE